jgi:hypothetical protein
MGRLVIELRIFRMMQFLKLGSTISHGLSLPREIRMVALVQVVKIGNLNQTLGWRNLCSFAHMKNYRIVPMMVNY